MIRSDRLKGYYDRKRETMGTRARRRHQETWLRTLVAHAWRRAPGVRRRLEAAGLRPGDIRTVEDLDRLPVIRKAAMPDLQREDPPFGGFCAVPPQSLASVFVSPGPIYEPFDRRDRSPWRTEVSAFAGGFRPGDVVVNTFVYHLTPAAHLIDRGLMVIGCTVVPTGPGNLDLQLGTIMDLRVTGYVGTPSFLMAILKRAAERGLERLPIEVAHVGAEALPESLRRTFETQYGILTRQSFGTADLGIVAYECREAAGMHLMEDAIFEICDPETGAPLPAGEVGEIVCTVNHKTYPMIRFGTGDLSTVTEAPCLCGRTSPRMLGWRGRADEVTKVRGMFIHPRQADEVAARFPMITRYQVVVTRQDYQDALTFHVELGAGEDPDTVAGMVEAIREVMKLRGEVRVVAPGSIPEGAKRIDDQRKWD